MKLVTNSDLIPFTACQLLNLHPLNAIYFCIHRAVAEEQRSLALGVQSVLFRALGSIPGPIVFGAIFDSSCVYWQFDCDGRRHGNCWVYDNNLISLRTFFVTTAGVSINFVLMLLCWIFYPPVTCSKKGTEEEKGKEKSMEEAKEAPRTVNNPVFNAEYAEEATMY